jgi:hypothetical protein
LLQGLEAAGADVIELGVPFSEPLADGPVIQNSSAAALAHGVDLARTLALLGRGALTVPVVLFSYLNPLLAAGQGILDRAAAAGAHGVLVTDLPVGADAEREAWIGGGPLDFVRLVAPTTPTARMAAIARHGRGFVYLISRLGVTGESSCRRRCRRPWRGCARRRRSPSRWASASRAPTRRARWRGWRTAWSSGAPSSGRPTRASIGRWLSPATCAPGSTTPESAAAPAALSCRP